jgi:phosphoglucosamine mutase
MSNLGLGLALRGLGIAHHTSDVGDRRVMEVMQRTGAVLGGEDSGHIILRGLHTTGDGILSGLRLMGVVASSGKPLSELARVMTVRPQVLMAVDVKTKPPLEELDAVMRQIAAVEKELAGQGRVLVRYSGTQPVCRVMVEGPHPGKTAAMCRRIADVVRQAVG